MAGKFLQFHFLTSYPSALLNRDDAGFAKRIPFGGVTRTRISSQCLKRHWRTFDGEHSLDALDVPQTIRSRLTFDRFILRPLLREEDIDGDVARAVTEALMVEVLGQSAKARKAKDEEQGGQGDDLQTGQITVLGEPEVDYLLEEARRVCKKLSDPKRAAKAVKESLGRDGRKNLESLRHGAGLGAALFGRMVTSDILARGDAALHVAHAFTVHAESAESDYFSAVDDLRQTGDDEQLGSGHIGSTELTSGLYYGYVVVDVPLLVSNLEGCERSTWRDADRDLAAQVIERIPHLIATVSPGAKLGSTAPYAYAHLVFAEAGSVQPRTLANAFLEPVRERPNLLANAYQALGNHVRELSAMYGNGVVQTLAGQSIGEDLCDALGVETAVSLADLARWAAEMVRE